MKFIGKKERERRRKSYSRCIDQRTGVELTLVPLLSKSSEWAQCVCMCHIKIRSHTTREDYIYILLAGRDMIQFNSTKKKRKSVYIFTTGISFFFRLKKTGNIATVIYLSDGRINQTWRIETNDERDGGPLHQICIGDEETRAQNRKRKTHQTKEPWTTYIIIIIINIFWCRYIVRHEMHVGGQL